MGPEAASPKPAPAKPVPRELPSREEIAAWIRQGDELPTLGALFDGLPVARYDTLITQVRKAELLPQHWQVISDRTIVDETEFERLAAVARLRRLHGDGETLRRRLDSLRTAWRELGGKQPSLWTVADLFAAMRRIIDRKLEIDFYQLLSAVREVWAGMSLPRGAEQLDMLWTCLDFIRQKTK